MMEARAGQHTGVVVNALGNTVPFLPNNLRVLGMTLMVPLGWSSVTMSTMLGAPAGADDESRRVSPLTTQEPRATIATRGVAMLFARLRLVVRDMSA
jgi:hypothetical protein